MNRVTVFGSYVMDLTTFSPHIPVVGETVFSGPFKMGPGGKGFNQAVAARKSSSQVRFMTKIGRDLFAPFVREAFDRFGISRENLLESVDSGTGVALIIVDRNNGNNAIAVAPEACNELSVEDVRARKEIFESCDVFLTQFEANLEATYEAIRIAKGSDAKVLLNPAPVKEFDHAILKYVDVIMPNEIEASLMTDIPLDGLDSIKEIAQELGKHVETVVLTLGGKGVYCPSVSDDLIPACKVATVDTTGAGDAFAGIFASYLSRSKSIAEAIDYARVGAAISTTRFGTSPSMPEKDEIEALLNEIKGGASR
jgi:ribokinase